MTTRPPIALAPVIAVALACATCADTSSPQEPALEIAYCRQPVVSGMKQIYAIREDGTGNRLLISAPVELNHHDWSPDGARLAAVGYASSTTWSIHVFNADGTGLARLTATDGVLDTEPAWSPDGTRIAFTRVLPDQGNREEIWIMNADGSAQHSVGLLGTAPEWAPDGSRLIYASATSGNYEIYSATPEGSDERRLTNTATVEFFPTFSPDGTRIAYAQSTGTTAADQTSWEIYLMNADGTGVTRLTDNAAFDGYPKWAPDGSRLSFESDRHQSGVFEVYVMRADGGGVRRVTTSGPGTTAINPVWRPTTSP